MPDFPVFQNPEFGTVRVVERDGEPWFVARDVAKALGYPESSLKQLNNLFQSVPDEWKGRNPIMTLGGEQEMLVISEQGLYFFLARSDKSAALPFQKWLAGEVIPALRKHGAYLTPTKIEEALSDPDTIIKLATTLKEERARRLALEAQTEADRPKVVFADSIAISETCILVRELAKLIKQSIGYDIGERRLFAWLRQHGYLHKTGSDHNMPTQKSMDMGLVVIQEGARIGSSGKSHITKTPKVTGKGQIYFVNKFKELYENGRLSVLSVAQSIQEVEA